MKNARHEMILELVRTQDIETQDELVAKLEECGFSTTQATVCRDIRQLELRKIPGRDGRNIYAPPAADVRGLKEKYLRTLSDAFVSVESAGNLMVIRTLSGMAMAAAAAIDSLDWRDILGCIAGDDTVFVALKNSEDGPELCGKLRKLADNKRVDKE